MAETILLFSEKPLTTEEVADIMRHTTRTIRRMARCGEIPGAYQSRGKKRTTWRFKRKEFLQWWERLGA